MKTLYNYLKTSKYNAFIILKPGFTNYVDEWHKMLFNNGWKCINEINTVINHNEANELYKMHNKKDFYKDLCNYMTSGNSIIGIWYKNCKDPINEMKELKDNFRKKYGKDEMKNGMHSSDSLENVNRESKIFFDI